MDKLTKLEKYRQCSDAAIVPSGLESTAFIQGRSATAETGAELIYARQDYPGCLVAEDVLADYEHATSCMAFSSGMAAATSIFQALDPGSSVVVPKQVYWPLQVWLNEFSGNQGIQVNWVERAETDAILAAIDDNTKLIWVEMLTNPDLHLLDVRGLSRRTRGDIKLVVNATCLSPILAKPLDLGADLVMHSVTKIIGGHNDLIGGAVSTAVEDDFWQKLSRLRWVLGNGMSARDAAMLYRSLMTLKQRVLAASANALEIAERLQGHPLVDKVIYPGLSTYKGKNKLKSNLTGEGYGPIIGLHMRLDSEQCRDFCANTLVWRNATTFGGYMSCLEHRASAEYMINQSQNDYVRLSVGLESVDVLLDDLFCALEHYELPIAV